MRMMNKMAGLPYTEEKMNEALAQLWAALDTLETYLGQHEGRFIVNDEPTIADLQLFFEFTDLIYLKLDWEESAKYP